MKSSLHVIKSKSNNVFDWLYVIASALAGYVFIAHGLEAIFQTSQLLPITQYVGMEDGMGSMFLLFVGALDTVVGFLLLFRPSYLLIAYASLWVLMPLYLQYMATGQLEIVAKILLWVAVAYMVAYSKNFQFK